MASLFYLLPKHLNTTSIYRIKEINIQKLFHMIVYFYFRSYICEQHKRDKDER